MHFSPRPFPFVFFTFFSIPVSGFRVCGCGRRGRGRGWGWGRGQPQVGEQGDAVEAEACDLEFQRYADEGGHGVVEEELGG